MSNRLEELREIVVEKYRKLDDLERKTNNNAKLIEELQAKRKNMELELERLRKVLAEHKVALLTLVPLKIQKTMNTIENQFSEDPLEKQWLEEKKEMEKKLKIAEKESRRMKKTINKAWIKLKEREELANRAIFARKEQMIEDFEKTKQIQELRRALEASKTAVEKDIELREVLDKLEDSKTELDTIEKLNVDLQAETLRIKQKVFDLQAESECLERLVDNRMEALRDVNREVEVIRKAKKILEEEIKKKREMIKELETCWRRTIANGQEEMQNVIMKMVDRKMESKKSRSLKTKK